MKELQEAVGDILPPNPIRVETGLSRYPVHRLAKHGDIAIDIHEKNEHGELSVKWEVDYGKKHGQPGPLAYKLDTLVINRRIEGAARPIPRIIKLGSLRDICRELGINEGQATRNIKKSLYQNASTFITARIRYRQNGGDEKTLEAGFNRYNVVFTGEELPDGRRADAVYIILSDIYMQVINGAMTRPLDYDYLRTLPPAPQRCYELLSYQMYAAIKNDLPRAKLLYSEFCKYAPLTRHLDWEHARSQLAKIHAPHKQSGYIARIDFQDTTDGDGQPDWIMLYQPGPKARADYRAFARRGGPVMLEMEPFPPARPALAASQQPALPLTPASSAGQALPEPSSQEAALIGHGITPAKAAELARQHDAATVAKYVQYLEYETAKKPGKIGDPAAWLYSAFTDGRGKPKGFTSPEEQKQREEARQAKHRAEAEERRRKQEEKSREDAERQAVKDYWSSLTKPQQAELEAEALAAAEETTRHTYEHMKQDGRGDGYLTLIRREHIRHILKTRQGEA